MEIIQHVNVSSNIGTVDLNSIPNTYDDLCLVYNLKMGLSSSFQFDDVGVRFNLDSGANYRFRGVQYRESAMSNISNASATFFLAYSATAQGSAAWGAGRMYISNYKEAQNKLISVYGMSEGTGTSVGGLIEGRWANTAAITSIRFYSLNGTDTFAGSTISLYGISRGSDGTTSIS